MNGPAAVLSVTAKIAAAQEKSHVLWYDSGATHHIVYDRSLLRDKRSPSVRTVVLGGGEEHAVECEGTAVLAGGPAGPVHLANVLCVPTLSLHLCSGSQVTNRGAVVTQG
jgi:hypothetical protein